MTPILAVLFGLWIGLSASRRNQPIIRRFSTWQVFRFGLIQYLFGLLVIVLIHWAAEKFRQPFLVSFGHPYVATVIVVTVLTTSMRPTHDV